MEEKKLYGILSYIGVLVLIPMFLAKDDEEVKFHVNQGLLLLLAGIASCILGYVPVIKYFAYILSVLVFVLSILGIINVIKGEKKELPIIGKYDILSKIMK